jgi:1-acyl-sn-glycerol-3-phosphate acyltransferase
MDQMLVKTLRTSLLDDIFKDLANSRREWLAKLFRILAWPSATRFAEISAIFDDYVKRFGFNDAMRRIMPFFVTDLRVWGQSNVPKEGPLLIISNHPGTYDSIAISATLPRNDLKIIAGGYPFLRHLPEASQHLIFVSADIKERMISLRNAIRHLQEGRSLLIFPSGSVEPDPAVLPGASQAMSAWSPSLELILRRVPDTQVLITIASGVISPRFLDHPLIRFWREKRDPQIVAEVLQILIQMLFPSRVRLSPNISFYFPLTMSELTNHPGDESLINLIVHLARERLANHRQEYGLEIE